MRTNELKIGNLIFDVVKNIEVEITTLNFQSIIEHCDDETKFKPIILTDIKLKEFGLENLKDTDEWGIFKTTNYFKISYIHPENVLFWYIQEDSCLCKQFHYVHQLQNLFFGLNNYDLSDWQSHCNH